MLRSMLLITIGSLVLNGFGCDSQKQDEKIRSLESEVKQLKAEMVELKQKEKAVPEHHYELRSRGSRTFRFDSATGETCIQLASEVDWRRKETKSQSCDCIDALNHWTKMWEGNDVERAYADDYYNSYVKRVCP